MSNVKVNVAMLQAMCMAIENGQCEQTEAGLHFPELGVTAKGEYHTQHNGGAWEKSTNLITTQGMQHLLSVAMGTAPKASAFYLALFSGATAPAANWTAANFASVASENVSMTEGYTNATRPVWTPNNVTATVIDNFGLEAEVTFATTSEVNITGVALLTNATRGGTSGVLVSASKYAAPRVFQNGDVLRIGYRVALTV